MRLLLFSGGLDSSALAAWQKPDLALTIDYGQRPAHGEIAAAAAIAWELGLRHETLTVDLSALGRGDMSKQGPSTLGRASEWWPYRNQMLITLAAMRYVAHGLSEVMIGSVSTDVHADGKSRFLRAMNRTLAAQEGGVRVTAPAREMYPDDLLMMSGFPITLLGLTFSCHVADVACGQCRGCTKHRETLARFGG
jgi:7-cyano-7-deazaguanine synthase